MDNVLTTHGLTKRYKNQLAVNCVNMTIRRGDIYGFVGENGDQYRKALHDAPPADGTKAVLQMIEDIQKK